MSFSFRFQVSPDPVVNNTVPGPFRFWPVFRSSEAQLVQETQLTVPGAQSHCLSSVLSVHTRVFTLDF
jgi:hypothetical protein